MGRRLSDSQQSETALIVIDCYRLPLWYGCRGKEVARRSCLDPHFSGGLKLDTVLTVMDRLVRSLSLRRFQEKFHVLDG